MLCAFYFTIFVSWLQVTLWIQIYLENKTFVKLIKCPSFFLCLFSSFNSFLLHTTCFPFHFILLVSLFCFVSFFSLIYISSFLSSFDLALFFTSSLHYLLVSLLHSSLFSLSLRLHLSFICFLHVIFLFIPFCLHFLFCSFQFFNILSCFLSSFTFILFMSCQSFEMWTAGVKASQCKQRKRFKPFLLLTFFSLQKTKATLD